MTILTMTATFGGLENQTLTLGDGLNVLELPNEGGKSSWCAFLRAMLYGVETRKGREVSEKNRFTPWSGAKMSGSMDVLWQGRAITLRRFPKGASPFGGFQAVYTGTEEPVPGLTAENVGQTLLGFGKEVFERTCFIGQGSMAFGPSAELEQRLAALASSGEEDVSYSTTEATLRTWRNTLQSNRVTGSTPRLRQRRDELLGQLSKLSEQEQEVRNASDKERKLLAQLEQETAAAKELARQRAAEQRFALDDAQQRLEQLRAAAPSPPNPYSALLFYFAPLALLFGGLFLFTGEVLLGAILLALGAAVGGGALVLRHHRDQLYQAQLATHRAQLNAAQAALDKLESWRPELDPEIHANAQNLRYLRDRLAQLRTGRAQLTGSLSASGDPTELRQQVALLRQQIAEEEEQYAALTAAMDALAAANAQLQQRFAPTVSALAGEILAKLTGGRYSSLSFTRSFEAMAGEESGQSHAAKLLSQGTADQAYLALRLAVCLLALPEDSRAPIVLDDALVSFDDRRLALALGVLRDFAADRQVLLFTCQSREKAALDRGGLH